MDMEHIKCWQVYEISCFFRTQIHIF